MATIDIRCKVWVSHCIGAVEFVTRKQVRVTNTPEPKMQKIYIAIGNQVVDMFDSSVQSTERTHAEAHISASILNLELALDAHRAAKEQRKGRANLGSLTTRDELSMWTEDQYNAQGQ
jgi:hypothetical protein